MEWYHSMQRTQSGLTLIESLAAMVAIAAICCVAAPSLATAAAKARDAMVRAAMTETLQRATTHAVVTATRVVLCPSSDGSTCLNGLDWTPGWIAFADPDMDRERASPHDTLLHVQPALEGGSRLRGTAGRARIVVQPRGGAAGSNVTFTICNQNSNARATALVLANSGRWRFATPTGHASTECAYGG